MARTYKITNGTLSVDLLATGATGFIPGKGGLGPNRVAPTHNFVQGGGISGGGLVSVHFSLVTDSWTLYIKGSSDDNVATQLRNLIELLVLAGRYHIEPRQNKPVYIESQTTGETNKRYSLVYGFPEMVMPDQFDFPFEGSDLVEHLHVQTVREPFWRSNAPGILGAALTLGATDGPILELMDRGPSKLEPSIATGGLIQPEAVDPVVGNGLVQVAEATTNLVTNPSLETNDTTYAVSGANTKERTTAQAKFGAYSLKCIYQDTAQFIACSVTVAAGANTFSAWAYIPSSFDGTQIEFDVEGFVGISPADERVDLDMSKRDQWQYCVLPNQIINVGDVIGTIRFRVKTGTPSAGAFIYVDGFQAEAKEYPTPTAIGDMGAGHAWTGAVHASTSTRAAHTLRYDIPNCSMKGTLAFKIIPIYEEDEQPGWKHIINLSDGTANNRIFMFLDPNDDIYKISYTGNGASIPVSLGSGDIVRLVNEDVVITWDITLDELKVYVDGTQVGATLTGLTGPAAAWDRLYVGATDTGSGQWSGWMDELILENGVVWTDEQISAHHLQGLAGTPYQVNDDTLLYLPFDEASRVHIANFRDDVEITHFKEDDGGAFTDLTLGDTLFPSVVAQWDALFFGSTDQPIKHIVLPKLATAGDLTTTNLGIYYSDGVASFSVLTLGTDYTCYPGPTLKDCFEQNNEDIVININHANDHVKDTYDTVDAFWLKIIELNVAPVYATNPVANETEFVYHQRSPDIEIPIGAIKGDVSPYLMMRLLSPSGGGTDPTFANTSRVIMGLKSRGLDKFVSHLNAGGDDNPGDWATTQVTDASAVADVQAPGGKHSAITFAGDSTMQPRIRLTGDDILDSWVGEYRAFVRLQQIGGAGGDCTVRLRSFIGGAGDENPHIDSADVDTQTMDDGVEVLDMGIVRLPFARPRSTDILTNVDVIFELHIERTTGTSTMRVYDLILIPVDEWVVGLDDPLSDIYLGSSALRGQTAVEVDGGVVAFRTAKMQNIGNWVLSENWARMGPAPKINNIETKARIYFLILHYEDVDASGDWGQPPFFADLGAQLSFELYGHMNYLFLRGAD